MPAVTLQDIAPGETITNDDVNNNNNTLEQAINGPNASPAGTGIEDVNFASNSPVVVASSIAGLGSLRAGKAGLLRVGSTPFDYIALVYDATLGKWVSDVVLSLDQQDTTTETGTGYGTAPTAEWPQVVIPNFKAIYDAGLRPQFWMGAFLKGSAGGVNVFLLPGLFSFNSGDTSRTSLDVTAPELSPSGITTQTWKAIGWTTAAFTAPTKSHVYLIARTKVSSGTGTYDNGSIRMRWVSA